MSDNQNNQNNNQNNQNKAPQRRFNWANIAVILLAAAFIFAMVYSLNGCQSKIEETTYSEAADTFLTGSGATTYKDNVVIICQPAKDSAPNGSYVVEILYSSGDKKGSGILFYASEDQYNAFVNQALALGYSVQYKPGSTFNLWTFVFYLILIAGVVFLIVLLVRTSAQNNAGNNSTM